MIPENFSPDPISRRGSRAGLLESWRHKRNDILHGNRHVILGPLVIENIDLEQAQFTLANKQDTARRVFESRDMNLSIATGEVSGCCPRRVVRNVIMNEEPDPGHFNPCYVTPSILDLEYPARWIMTDEQLRNNSFGKPDDLPWG